MTEKEKIACRDGELAEILSLFGIFTPIESSETLQCYDYTEEESDNGERCVRLIVKVALTDGAALVVRLMLGEAPDDVIAAQWEFSQLLRENGILTPLRYKHDDSYIAHIEKDGLTLTATAEAFADGEIKLVDEEIQYLSGVTLAQTHNIAEKFDAHVKSAGIFDPLGRDDLTDYDGFVELREKIPPSLLSLYEAVLSAYERRRASLLPVKIRPAFAVQGDMSDCNLYLSDGRVGIFDFNNCGDSVLLCDAVMQAIFTSRLMDYAREITPAFSDSLFRAFMRGYHSVRPLGKEDMSYASDIYALEDAMWATGLTIGDNCVKKSLESANKDAPETERSIKEQLSHMQISLERGYNFDFLQH